MLAYPELALLVFCLMYVMSLRYEYSSKGKHLFYGRLPFRFITNDNMRLLMNYVIVFLMLAIVMSLCSYKWIFDVRLILIAVIFPAVLMLLWFAHACKVERN